MGASLAGTVGGFELGNYLIDAAREENQKINEEVLKSSPCGREIDDGVFVLPIWDSGESLSESLNNIGYDRF